MIDKRKRHIVSLEKMPADVRAAFNEKYPGGIEECEDDIQLCPKPNGEVFFAVTIDLPEDIYVRYLLSPRVKNEKLCPYRKTVRSYFAGNEPADGAALMQYLHENIRFFSEPFHNRMPDPRAVLKSGCCPEEEKDLLFCLLARALGIPARLNPYTGDAEYYLNGTKLKKDSQSVTLRVGDVIVVGAAMTENDTNPDTGYEENSHTVTQNDLDKGFKVSFTVKVTENGGRYRDSEAKWKVTFTFSQ